MHVPPGLRIDIVASEPLIESPVAFEWGADGKLWVVEMRDYPNADPDSTQRRHDPKAQGMESSNEGMGEGPSPLPSHLMGAEREGNMAASARPTSMGLVAGGGSSRHGHNGRIVFLEDTNGGGVYNKAAVFLDGLSYPNGLCPWRKGVIVSAGGEIFYSYTRYDITTKDDRELSGVITAETPDYVTLTQPGGVVEALPRRDLEKIASSKLSLMPDGFESALPKQSMADLISYIANRH